VAPVGQIVPAGRPTKPPHYILEFTAGTRWSGGELPRSGRVILRLAEDGLECDPDFAANTATLAARAGAGLISGLNGAPEDDLAARAWVREVVGGWRDAGLPTIHLELAEYARAGAPRDVVREYAPLVNSLGLSLAELVEFEGSGDPPTAAVRVAAQFGLARVVVHADAWSLMVHRGDPATAATALKTGNLLAAARAANGRPTTDPAVPAGAVFVTTHPASRKLGGGWRVECVPSPYLARPAATVGLGDTFVAGLLLAGCLSVSRTRATAP
jgi:ADP-dependent phosphofructokinase/glucokinase